MATDLENLVAAKSSITTQIATLSATLSSSTGATSYVLDGQSVSRLAAEQRLNEMFDRLEMLNRLIQMEEQPIEIVTYVV